MSLPLNQQRHSNISTVRLKVKGKRFEIACYKNKVLAFRSGDEKNLDEVIQIERVFVNVSQGEYANKKELKAAFGDMSELDILKHILLHGELQVAELERSAENQKLWTAIVTFVADHCVNPVTKRKYAASIIESAMKEVGFAVRDGPPKPQALILIKELTDRQVIPICRAQMRVRVWGPHEVEAAIRGGSGITIEKTEDLSPSQRSYELLLDTSLFRGLEVAIRKIHGASLFVTSPAVTAEGDGTVEEAMLDDGTVHETPTALPSMRTYKERIEALFALYALDQLSSVDSMLAKYQGNEEFLLEALVGKYGPEQLPPEELTGQPHATSHQRTPAHRKVCDNSHTAKKSEKEEEAQEPDAALTQEAVQTVGDNSDDENGARRKPKKKVAKKVVPPKVSKIVLLQPEEEEEDFVTNKQLKKERKAKKDAEPEPDNVYALEGNESDDYFYETPTGR